jgi:hypothetical protein
VTAAHLDEEPATQRATEALLDANPDLVAFLAIEPVISRQYLDPYLGGISIDGATVYIARDLPETLPQTGIRPDKYIALHERSEWWCMTKLGMDYLGADGSDGAHHFACRIEHNALIEDGHDPDAYEDELAGYIARDETEDIRPDDVPPDLYLGPYEEDQDAEDRKVLPVLKAAAVARTGEKLDHDTVTYGKGDNHEFCRTCEYSDHAENPACRFVRDIASSGWCVLWSE